MSTTGAGNGSRAPRGGRGRYVAAIVVLVLGLAVLGGGVYAVIMRHAAPAAGAAAGRTAGTTSELLEDATTVAVRPAAAAESRTPTLAPSVPASDEPTVAPTEKVADPNATAEAEPSVAAADIEFDVSTDEGEADCSFDDCWLWTVTADASCSSAEAHVETSKEKAADAPTIRAFSQAVGAFVTDEPRIVEIKVADDEIGSYATLSVTCTAADDGL